MILKEALTSAFLCFQHFYIDTVDTVLHEINAKTQSESHLDTSPGCAWMLLISPLIAG
ncbi:MAG: hypothetical protein GX801_03640 [Fibrobacter sp.]|nr:hypothetical protein [Fibrobacter sp.]